MKKIHGIQAPERDQAPPWFIDRYTDRQRYMDARYERLKKKTSLNTWDNIYNPTDWIKS